MTFFEPSPLLLALIFVRTFVYLEVLALLALARGLIARGPARLAALLALLLALAGLALAFAPALNLNQGPVFAMASQAMTRGQGLPALLLASAPLLVSAVLPGRRAAWIDALHVILIGTLLGLWAATRWL